jgi:DNA mismatch repair ATPase MutS
LDELFKGTNTIERISSAKAILSYLNRSNNFVYVSTHDIELTSLLQDEYELYYFGETITKGEINFDYTLKKGVPVSGNAIKILEMQDYPISIIDEANELVQYLTVNKAM